MNKMDKFIKQHNLLKFDSDLWPVFFYSGTCDSEEYSIYAIKNIHGEYVAPSVKEILEYLSEYCNMKCFTYDTLNDVLKEF